MPPRRWLRHAIFHFRFLIRYCHAAAFAAASPYCRFFDVFRYAAATAISFDAARLHTPLFRDEAFTPSPMPP